MLQFKFKLDLIILVYTTVSCLQLLFQPHILKSSTQPTLQGNSDDWFLIYSPEPLGTLNGLQLWHDNTGNSPDWQVQYMFVLRAR